HLRVIQAGSQERDQTNRNESLDGNDHESSETRRGFRRFFTGELEDRHQFCTKGPTDRHGPASLIPSCFMSAKSARRHFGEKIPKSNKIWVSTAGEKITPVMIRLARTSRTRSSRARRQFEYCSGSTTSDVPSPCPEKCKPPRMTESFVSRAGTSRS